MMNMPKTSVPFTPAKEHLHLRTLTHCNLHKLEATCSAIIRYYEEMKGMSTENAYQLLRKKCIKFRTDKDKPYWLFKRPLRMTNRCVVMLRTILLYNQHLFQRMRDGLSERVTQRLDISPEATVQQKRGQVEATLVSLSVINRLTKDKDDSPMTDILTVHVIEDFMAGFSAENVQPSAHTIRNYGLVLKVS